MSKLGSKRLSKCKKAISEYLSNFDWGYSYFSRSDKEKRNEIISLLKFNFEVIAFIVIVYSFNKEYFEFSLLESTGMLALLSYSFLMLIGLGYVFGKVLYLDYMPRKEVSEMSINISYYIIFTEIIASIFFLICVISNEWIFSIPIIGSGLMLLFTITLESFVWKSMNEQKNEEIKRDERE